MYENIIVAGYGVMAGDVISHMLALQAYAISHHHVKLNLLITTSQGHIG